MYFYLKIFHILSSILIFGMTIGILLYQYCLNQEIALTQKANKNITEIVTNTHFISKIITIAIPIMLSLQLISGFSLLYTQHYLLPAGWMASVLGTYGMAVLFWFGVIFLQMRLQENCLPFLELSAEKLAYYLRESKKWMIFVLAALISWFMLVYMMVMLKTPY